MTCYQGASLPGGYTLDCFADGVQGYAAGANNAASFGRNNDLDSAKGTGVAGTSSTGTGVYGSTNDVSKPGVRDDNTNSAATSKGVYGTSVGGSGAGMGVRGQSGSGPGLRGDSASSYGVQGLSARNVGVLGQATATSSLSPGVYGSATQGYGVYGYSTNSDGISGQSGGQAAGCVGFTSVAGGYGLYVGSTVSGGYAGGFAGAVLVAGKFTATGTKSAALDHPDGSHRLLYCLESPESWFEDFGQARLTAGAATVTLDADFAAVVQSGTCLIYLTPRGDSKGLYVSAQSATGFEVREQQGGTSTIDFNYRVVAKRKDVPRPRLAKVSLPAALPPLQRPPLR